ncbi:MAG TPA: hypothetical protein VIM64_00170 [Puia sp.]
MRPSFSLSLGLIVLLSLNSCSKSGGSKNIVGNWRMVAYTTSAGIVYISTDIHSLAINSDRTYSMRTGDSIISSGTYHLQPPTASEKHTVFYISDQRYADGYNIGFTGDTLNLIWRGVYVDMPPVTKYVRR